MKNTMRILAIGLTCAACSRAALAGGALPDNDIVMRALVDEMHRTMNELQFEGLPKPYFAQYTVEDQLTYSYRASFGGVLRADDTRRRQVMTRVRVGDMTLDNVNFRGSFGGGAWLPVDDEYYALRQEIWQATDGDYTRALETLTRKQAYLREKDIKDRPVDFTEVEPVKELEPSAEIAFEEARWQDNIARLSEVFTKHPEIQDAQVSFLAGAVNKFIVTSEETQIRTGDSGAFINVQAQRQADDGMELQDSLLYLALQVDGLPDVEQVESEIDELCDRLNQLAEAEILEHYVGPVLFEAKAAGRVFEAMLGSQLAAQPTPVGYGGGFGDDSFEKKIGLRILPRTFDVHDDPTEQEYDGTVLAGAYNYDDEGVPPRRVELVENGILKSLVAGRAPTKKISGSTGHARSSGFSDPRATVGCLYVADEEGMPADQLKEELVQTAREEGLEYGLRITGIQQGSGGQLGDPIYVYKVYVEDGREELVRGLTFLDVNVRAMKRILAAGNEPEVYNSIGSVGSSYICPAMLFEELELTRTSEEFSKTPILPPPQLRDAGDNGASTSDEQDAQSDVNLE